MVADGGAERQFLIFSETLTNLFTNFIPNESVSGHDMDPPWTTTSIKIENLAQENNQSD